MNSNEKKETDELKHKIKILKELHDIMPPCDGKIFVFGYILGLQQNLDNIQEA